MEIYQHHILRIVSKNKKILIQIKIMLFNKCNNNQLFKEGKTFLKEKDF
jgi:hypothetical protein